MFSAARIGWLSKKRQPKSRSRKHAAALYDVWVKNGRAHFKTQDFRLPAHLKVPFLEKTALYCEASVLLALMQMPARGDQDSEILEEYRRLIVDAPQSREAVIKTEAVNSAMKSLTALIEERGERQRLQWSRDWLAGIGYEASSPAVLALVAVRWLDYCAAVGKAVRELRAAGGKA